MEILGIIIGALGLYVCVINYISIGVNVYRKRHGIDGHISPIPLVAGIMMFISAVILLPENIWALGFLAFPIDHTYPLLVYSVIATRFFTRDPNQKNK